MSHIAVPIGLSLVTTVIGFLGFVPSPLPAIRKEIDKQEKELEKLNKDEKE